MFLPTLRLYENRDFPGGTVVKNPPANAGDTGSIPGPGRSHMPWSNKSHVPQLLKPTHLKPVLRNKRSHRSESPRTAVKSSLRRNQRESPRSNKDPMQTKKKKNENKVECMQMTMTPSLFQNFHHRPHIFLQCFRGSCGR